MSEAICRHLDEDASEDAQEDIDEQIIQRFRMIIEKAYRKMHFGMARLLALALYPVLWPSIKGAGLEFADIEACLANKLGRNEDEGVDRPLLQSFEEDVKRLLTAGPGSEAAAEYVQEAVSATGKLSRKAAVASICKKLNDSKIIETSYSNMSIEKHVKPALALIADYTRITELEDEEPEEILKALSWISTDFALEYAKTTFMSFFSDSIGYAGINSTSTSVRLKWEDMTDLVYSVKEVQYGLSNPEDFLQVGRGAWMHATRWPAPPLSYLRLSLFPGMPLLQGAQDDGIAREYDPAFEYEPWDPDAEGIAPEGIAGRYRAGRRYRVAREPGARERETEPGSQGKVTQSDADRGGDERRRTRRALLSARCCVAHLDAAGRPARPWIRPARPWIRRRIRREVK